MRSADLIAEPEVLNSRPEKLLLEAILVDKNRDCDKEFQFKAIKPPLIS
jgi:hypothetical protein